MAGACLVGGGEADIIGGSLDLYGRLLLLVLSALLAIFLIIIIFLPILTLCTSNFSGDTPRQLPFLAQYYVTTQAGRRIH